MQAVDLSNEPTPKRDNNQLKRPASVSVSFSSTGQLEGSAKTVPAHKLKKPKRLSLPTFLRDYIWTPWTPTLSSLDDVNQPPAIQVNEGVNRGPGRPPYVFSDEQTRKLIKLVIKTDVPFDHIQACLADEVTKKGPSQHACREQWKRIFGHPPDDVRLKNPEGKKRRYKDHMKAYDRYRKWQCKTEKLDRGVDKLYRNSLHSPAGRDFSTHSGDVASDQASEPRVGDTEQPINHSAQHLAYTPPITPSLDWNQLSGPRLAPNLPATPVSPEPHDLGPATAAERIEAHYNSSSRHQPTDHVEQHKRDQTIKNPKTPSEVEQKYGMERGYIDWVARSSFVSRISSRLSRQSFRKSAADAYDSVPGVRQAEPNGTVQSICALLEDARSNSGSEWLELGKVIRKTIEEHPASINERDHKGRSPLHLAVELACFPAVCALMEYGADPDAVDNNGASVSAYTRDFERSTTLGHDKVAHIAWTRELLKYDQTPLAGTSHLKKSVAQAHKRVPSVAKPPALQTVPEKPSGSTITMPSSTNDHVLDSSTSSGPTHIPEAQLVASQVSGTMMSHVAAAVSEQRSQRMLLERKRDHHFDKYLDAELRLAGMCETMAQPDKGSMLKVPIPISESTNYAAGAYATNTLYVSTSATSSGHTSQASRHSQAGPSAIEQRAVGSSQPQVLSRQGTRRSQQSSLTVGRQDATGSSLLANRNAQCVGGSPQWPSVSRVSQLSSAGDHTQRDSEPIPDSEFGDWILQMEL